VTTCWMFGPPLVAISVDVVTPASSFKDVTEVIAAGVLTLVLVLVLVLVFVLVELRVL
jgi:hypothetical protein